MQASDCGMICFRTRAKPAGHCEIRSLIAPSPSLDVSAVHTAPSTRLTKRTPSGHWAPVCVHACAHKNQLTSDERIEFNIRRLFCIDRATLHIPAHTRWDKSKQSRRNMREIKGQQTRLLDTSCIQSCPREDMCQADKGHIFEVLT
jgi:hypothetical protein